MTPTHEQIYLQAAWALAPLYRIELPAPKVAGARLLFRMARGQTLSVGIEEYHACGLPHPVSGIIADHSYSFMQATRFLQ